MNQILADFRHDVRRARNGAAIRTARNRVYQRLLKRHRFQKVLDRACNIAGVLNQTIREVQGCASD